MELWKILLQCLGALLLLLLGMLLQYLWQKRKQSKLAAQRLTDTTANPAPVPMQEAATEPAPATSEAATSTQTAEADTKPQVTDPETREVEGEKPAPAESQQKTDAEAPTAAPEIDLSYMDPLIRHYIVEQRHFADPELNIQDLAKGIGSNRTYVWRFFTQRGTSFNTYVSVLRSECAAELLRTTNMTMAEVGMQAGFRTTNTFILSFKKHFGVTPKQYQITYLNKNS